MVPLELFKVLIMGKETADLTVWEVLEMAWEQQCYFYI